MDPKAIAYASAVDDNSFRHEMNVSDVREGRFPTFGFAGGTSKCLIWGDSHAMALVKGIDAACKSRKVQGFQATHSNTPPLLDFIVATTSGLNEQSPQFNRAVLDYAISQKVDLVILAAAWNWWSRNPGFEKALENTLETLDRAGIRVAIVQDIA